MIPDEKFQSMDNAPRNGRMLLLRIAEPAGTDYAKAIGQPRGWVVIAEGRYEPGRWRYFIQGEPVGWKFEEPGDAEFIDKRFDHDAPPWPVEDAEGSNRMGLA